MTIQEEKQGQLFGVNGRFTAVTRRHNEKPGCFCLQKWGATRIIKNWGGRGEHQITVEIRFDDECGNGHNTFSITGYIKKLSNRDWETGGCIHEEIAKYFPELNHLIKWHLMSTDEPMHYIANTVYHAGNRDHRGLELGEVRQLRNSKTGLLCWRLEADAELLNYVDSEVQPTETATLRYVPWNLIGEGKPRELNYARSSAKWPEATDEELSVSSEELTKVLQARLPALMEAFRKDMDACGFLWKAEDNATN